MGPTTLRYGNLPEENQVKHTACLVLLLTTTSVAKAATSIVGTWDFPNQTCENPIHITAMALRSEDVDCHFKSVKRVGNTVIWKGKCDDAEGGSAQTVTARLSANGQLTILYSPGGNVVEKLTRCTLKP
jgi:hypothetical protein